MNLLLLLIVFACGIAAQKAPLNIAALNEVKTLPDVVWAPDGKKCAYAEDNTIKLYDVRAKSIRDLVSLAALGKAATPVTEPSQFQWQNRRVKEETFQWAPSSDALLIREGGDLFLFRIDSGGWNRLTETPADERDPKLSPDGRRVSYRIQHDLYCLDIEAKKVTRLTHDGSETRRNAELDWVYPEELDLGAAHWWSPDSKQIAYLQFDVSRQSVQPHMDLLPLRAVYEPQRYPKAGDPNADVHLGIVAPAGGETRWLDPGGVREHLLARVVWTPDAVSLWVQRLNRVQNQVELVALNAAGGARRVVLREEDPYWINIGDEFRFLRGGAEFLWASERDGFRHLYRYSANGKLVAKLTRGDWEVTAVAGVNEPLGAVYYISTEPSPLERHLYRVNLDGGGRARLSQETGSHDVTMSPDCEHYLDDYTGLATPPRRLLRRTGETDGPVIADPNRPLLDRFEFLSPEIVELKAADGALLYGRLTRPAGFQKDHKYPAIVRVYGGPGAQIVTHAWTGFRWEQVMAQRGFVIWELDNRGSAGRGHKWEAELFRRLGAKELEDQKAGVRHLISLGFVDPDRIGIEGWSYGGYMTLYSLFHAPGLFRAGIAGASLADWRNYDTIYTERYLGLPSENEKGYRESSPIHDVANLAAKLLVIHNFEDDNVLFQNAFQLADALQKAGKEFEWMMYPQKQHHVTGAALDHMRQLMTAFFEKNLK